MSRHGRHSNNKGKIFCGRHSHLNDIKDVLKLFADDDDMRVTLILSVEDCEEAVLENVQVISVKDDLVTVRRERRRERDCEHDHDHGRCRCGEIEFVNICCICAVKACCEDILEEILEGGRDED
jgi:hypothetical protein